MTCAGSSAPPPRLLLALEACETELSVVLACSSGPETSVLAAVTESAVKRASETLAPRVAAVLGEAGLTPRDLSGLAVVRGPGSFTGIRVVLAFAAGLGAGLGLPQAGLDYLPLLAAGAPVADGSLAVLTYARSALLYFQAFGPDRTLLTALQVLAPDAALAAVAALPGPRTCLGSGLVRQPELAGALAGLARILPESANRPAPEVLAAAAARAAYALKPVPPLYVRPSDAEDNLAAFALARGLSPEDVRRATGR